MKLHIDPDVPRTFLHAFLFSLKWATVSAVVLTIAALVPPPLDDLIILVGTLGGAMLALFLYTVWGSASCFADIQVWFTAWLSVIESVAIHWVVCTLMSKLTVNSSTEAFTPCTPNSRRSDMYISFLTISFVTFLVWIRVHYWTWQARRKTRD